MHASIVGYLFTELQLALQNRKIYCESTPAQCSSDVYDQLIFSQHSQGRRGQHETGYLTPRMEAALATISNHQVLMYNLWPALFPFLCSSGLGGFWFVPRPALFWATSTYSYSTTSSTFLPASRLSSTIILSLYYE